VAPIAYHYYGPESMAAWPPSASLGEFDTAVAVRSKPSTAALQRKLRQRQCARVSVANPPPEVEDRLRTSSAISVGIWRPHVSIGNNRRHTKHTMQNIAYTDNASGRLSWIKYCAHSGVRSSPSLANPAPAPIAVVRIVLWHPTPRSISVHDGQ
jgi:hypothetical protein